MSAYIQEPMSKPIGIVLLIIAFLTATAQTTYAQTSWRGTTSTSWSNAANWTNGVPTATVDAILGNASFTGTFQPTVNTSAACKSLTVGGTVNTTLTLTSNLSVSGSVTINSNATVNHPGSTLTLSGDWMNSGTYNTSSGSARIIFAGVAQTIGGSVTTTFRRLTINTSSTVTLARNIIATGTSSYIYVSGTLNPGESPTYTVTSNVYTRVYNNGRIKVNASTFAGNYILSGTVTLSAGSIVEYSSTTTNQTVSNSYTYSTLVISGTGTKSLAGNLNSLTSSTSTRGNLYVNSGTLDLLGFTANRGTTWPGGTISVASNAVLKIGGTGGFPANYNTKSLNINSTVEYYGTNQTVTALTYGHLMFSSSTGAATKTMPATAFTVEGNFSSSVGSGTSVAFTSASNITFNGNITIGASTTFNAGSNSHLAGGNWTNSGTFTGGTSTITFDGANAVISGSGAQNFNNISFISTAITASATNINVAGNLSTTGAGQFTQSSGLLTMTGTTRTISGADIVFNDLTISGTVSTSASFIINGNMTVSGSFTASAGAVTMAGTSKTLSGAGTISFSTLSATGSITTASNFNISALLDVLNSFTASAGTATFTGNSLLSGTANLFNVTINGTSLQLSSSSVLGIANVFTITAGTLNVTTSKPNTVNFNGSGAQSVNAITYHNLTFSTGNTKSALGAITVNGNLTISASTTFTGNLFTHTILGNWINNGTFTPSLGTVQFTGVSNTSITGVTTFYNLTINKSATTNIVSLVNNVTANTVTMTTGSMLTGARVLTITNTRSGNGIILGTITRTHLFLPATAYAFEGPYNTITFSSLSGVSSVTVTITPGAVSDFPNGSSINREYSVSIGAGTYNGTLRLHYEDAEMNGNNEASMILWNYASGAWTGVGKTGNSTTNNYVEYSGLTNMNFRWTCYEMAGVARWTGAVSTDWNTAGNWATASGAPVIPPSVNDVVQIGTGAIVNQPTISTAVNVKGIVFGSVAAATLTLGSGGSLTTGGNISGSWSADATHTINTGAQTMTVNGNLLLSSGTINRSINLNIGTGTVNVNGSLNQTGNAAIQFTGAGTLNIGTDFNYTSGAFTGGTGTVVYNGTVAQNVAPVTYNHVTINKSAGTAMLANDASLTGNLLISAGYFDVNTTTLTIGGNVTINSGTTFDCGTVNVNAAGNWTNSGTFLSTTGSVTFNGTGTQTISAGNFNNLVINKSTGTAVLSGNNTINGNLNLSAGTLNLGTYTLNRGTAGGNISIGNGATLLVSGANNFPSGFSTQTLGATSIVHYNGTVAQSVAGFTYGHLTFSNGGSNNKTLLANTIVAGDITINTGSTFHSGGFTITLSGNWSNNGTFVPSTGAIALNGSSKTVTGNTTFNRVIVNGSYTVAGSNITYNGHLQVTGTGNYVAGTGVAVLNGDLSNSGALSSAGTTTFTGTSLQTLRLINALVSTSTGIVNFNGNVAPVMNSTTSPTFATLNINNTAGITPSVGWTVMVAMTVNTGSSFFGGGSSHDIYGSFTNSGTVTSTGNMNFIPATAKTINLGTSGFSSDGTVTFGGAGQITISGTPGVLTNVHISNTHSAGITPPSGWTLDSNFVISSNSLFNAGSYTYTVGGDIQSDGTLNGGTSTFIMNSSDGNLTASATTDFNNFTVAGTIMPLTDYRVNGSFTNNGTYDGTVGVLIMSGSTAGSIDGTTTPNPINQLMIDKSSNAIVTMNVNVGSVGFLNVNRGILFTSSRSITQDAGGGILLISNGATLRLGGTNSLPGFSGYNLEVNSNVDYAGTGTQAIGNAAEYGNLLITTATTKNAFVPVTVNGNLSISAGTLATSTVTLSHSIKGNFTMTGGSITGTASTYVMNGTNDQTLTLLSNLENLTVNKSAGLLNLGSNVTVNTITNLTAGKVNLGSYNFTSGNSGSITNYDANKYFIATGTGTLVQRVANGGSKIFPVGLLNDYMPATVALTAGSTADQFNVRLLQEAYFGGTSGTVATSLAVRGTWMIGENVAGGSTATITLQWPVSREMAGFNRALSRLGHYQGFWDYGPTNLAASGSNPYTLSRSGFTSFSPFAVSTFNALPVTWISFNGNHENGNNYLTWITSDEENNSHFVVEASIDGINYSSVGQVNGSGTTSSLSTYHFTHYHVTAPVVYYRIKQVDNDGTFSYSTTIRISTTAVNRNTVNLTPNPVVSTATLDIYSFESATVTFSIVDGLGRTLQSGHANVQKGINKIPVDLSRLGNGIYFLRINNGNGWNEVKKFVKQ